MPFPCGNVTNVFKIKKTDDTNTQIKDSNSMAEIGIPPYDQFSFSQGRASYVTLGAGITVEASLVMPLIIFAIVSLIQIMIFMNVQLNMQTALYRQTMKAAGYSFAAEAVLEGLPCELSGDDHAAVEDIVRNGITELLIKHMVINELGDRFFEKPWVSGGEDGIQVIFSGSVGQKDIDVILHYELSLMYNIFGIREVPMIARAHIGKWTGVTRIPDEDSESGETADDADRVYITKNGAVYHLYRDCTYLAIKLSSIDYSDVGNRRNASGGKYYPCSTCCKGQPVTQVVYISRYGDCYHADSRCKTIYHNILEVSKNKVEGRRLCSKCRDRKGGEKQ